jgi:FixJ family two-component response regulator
MLLQPVIVRNDPQVWFRGAHATATPVAVQKVRIDESVDVTKPDLIAVIDDDAGMRVSLDGLLRSLGHRTALFGSAEAFLQAEAPQDVVCVLSDLNMPGGMSGLELARRLAVERPAVAVILMTGFCQPQCREEVERSEVRCLLWKPFDEATLISCLDEALGT